MSVNVLPASIASIYGLRSIEEPAQRDMLTIVTVDDQVVGVVVLLASRGDVFRGFGKGDLSAKCESSLKQILASFIQDCRSRTMCCGQIANS